MTALSPHDPDPASARIPLAPLLLTAGGLLPFLWGALLSAGWVDPGPGALLGLGASGPLLMVRYGVVILCFMAGVLWGFATRTTGARAAACYTLSVLPALWAFLNPGTSADAALINLMIGFAGVLLLDLAFSRWGLTPPWWMSLRLPVSTAVLICLGIGVWA